MKTWNFGIVGAGVIADFHARAIQSINNARLTGVCDSEPEKAKDLARKYSCKTFTDYKELIQSDEIDIVTIATPSGFHLEPTVEAAKYGKHVICEKPLEITLKRIDEMIKAHEKSKTYLGGIFNYRFNESLQPLKKAIENHRFGTVTFAAVHVPWWRTDDYYKNNWRGTWKLDGGGALMNQSIHMIDILQYLMGPIESLQAYTATLGHPQIETEDIGVCSLQFKNKALGLICGTTTSFPGQFRRLEITGTKGTVVQIEDSFSVWQFDEELEEDKQILSIYGEIKGGSGASNPTAIAFDNHARNIAAFIEAIEHQKKFAIDGYEARKAVEIILAIYKSSREKKIIKLG